MKALQLTAWKTNPTFNEVEIPSPGKGEVLIKMCGAGVCHSDLHVIHDREGSIIEGVPTELPLTLGHENAGYIAELGADVHGFEVGDAVVIHPSAGCGYCEHCHGDFETYCSRTATHVPGLAKAGGMAEYLLVDSARHLIPLGDVTPWDAAPMTDAGLTSYHAVKSALPILTPTSTAVVIGVGGLGHMAVQFLRQLCGATIIAVDTSAEALELARELGADHCLKSDESTLNNIRQLTGGYGAQAVFDFVGVQQTVDVAKASVRPTGVLHIVGLGQGCINWMPGLVQWEAPVSTHLGGTHEELREIVALMQRGRIKAESTLFHLSDALEVLAKLHRGEIVGRAVLVPDDFQINQ